MWFDYQWNYIGNEDDDDDDDDNHNSKADEFDWLISGKIGSATA